LLLKLRRGIKEEKFRVEVNMNIEGKFFLGQFEQDHSWIQHPSYVLNKMWNYAAIKCFGNLAYDVYMCEM
jgi:hypothetical protein